MKMTDAPATESRGINDAMVHQTEDGVWTYRASAIYSCQNALLMARLGYAGVSTPPAWLKQRYEAGHDHEPLILKKLDETFNIKTYARQDTVDLQVGSGARIRGHIDALGTSAHGEFIYVTHINGVQVGEPRDPFRMDTYDVPAVVDAKALSQSSTETWLTRFFEGMPYYGWQQGCYQHALSVDGHPLPVIMAVKNKNTDDHWVCWFGEPWVGKAELLGKVLNIEAMAAEGEPALFREECNPQMFPCLYFHMHDSKRVTRGVGGPELARMASQRAQLDFDIKRATKLRDDLDVEIREAYENKEDSKTTPDYTVTTYHSTSSSVNWARLGADFPGATKEKYTESKTSDKLSVKVTPRKGKK